MPYRQALMARTAAERKQWLRAALIEALDGEKLTELLTPEEARKYVDGFKAVIDFGKIKEETK